MIDPRWSWLFAISGLAALWLITRKNRWGLALEFGKELAWIAYAIATHQPGFVLSGAIFAVVCANGFRRWSRPDPDRVPTTISTP